MCLAHSRVRTEFVWINMDRDEMWRRFYPHPHRQFPPGNTCCWQVKWGRRRIPQRSRHTHPFAVWDTLFPRLMRSVVCSQRRNATHRLFWANTIGVALSVVAGSTTSCSSIPPLLTYYNSRTFGSLWYGAECTCEAPGVESIRCFATLILPKWPNHIIENDSNIWVNFCRYLK